MVRFHLNHEQPNERTQHAPPPPQNKQQLPDKIIFTGDNLKIMRGINSKSVDLIYLDPPFNSKKDWEAPIPGKGVVAAFKDIWTLSDIDLAELDLLENKHPNLYRVIQAAMKPADKAYLIYMATRLLEMKRILKSNGSIYLHCDDAMCHYLKLVMDAIFGRDSFRNHIGWQRTKGGKANSGQYARNSDHLLYYANEGRVWNPQYTEPETNNFNQNDNDGRGFWCAKSLTGQQTRNGESGEPWKGYDPNKIGHHWAVPRTGLAAKYIEEKFIPGFSEIESIHERLDLMEENDLISWSSRGTPRFKFYEKASKGAPATDYWSDIDNLKGNAGESVGYPTQKPLALLERIIEASSNPGDVVFDPFCGCATTLVSADKLDRNWIGIDLSPVAVELVRDRIRKEQGDLIDYMELESRIREIKDRDDIPKRTDLGKLPHYTTHKKDLYGEQEGKCNGCKHETSFKLMDVDHIIAEADGGTDHKENLQLLCRHCNSVKGDRGMKYLKAKLAE